MSGPKLNSNTQKPPACKISSHLVLWGLSYRHPLVREPGLCSPPFQKVSMIPSLILIWLAGLLWNLGPENCCTTGTGHSSSLKASIQPVLDSILARSWTFLRKENNSSFSLDVLGYFCKQVLLKLEKSNCQVYHIVVIL